MSEKKEKTTKAVEKTTTSKKPTLKTKDYPLEVRTNIGGVWKEKGEKIKLTTEGYRYMRSIKKVK